METAALRNCLEITHERSQNKPIQIHLRIYFNKKSDVQVTIPYFTSDSLLILLIQFPCHSIKLDIQPSRLQTTASTSALSPSMMVFTPISFFLLKLKLSIYPFFCRKYSRYSTSCLSPLSLYSFPCQIFISTTNCSPR